MMVFLAFIEKNRLGVTPPHRFLWLTQPRSVYMLVFMMILLVFRWFWMGECSDSYRNLHGGFSAI